MPILFNRRLACFRVRQVISLIRTTVTPSAGRLQDQAVSGQDSDLALAGQPCYVSAGCDQLVDAGLAWLTPFHSKWFGIAATGQKGNGQWPAKFDFASNAVAPSMATVSPAIFPN